MIKIRVKLDTFTNAICEKSVVIDEKLKELRRGAIEKELGRQHMIRDMTLGLFGKPDLDYVTKLVDTPRPWLDSGRFRDYDNAYDVWSAKFSAFERLFRMVMLATGGPDDSIEITEDMLWWFE